MSNDIQVMKANLGGERLDLARDQGGRLADVGGVEQAQSIAEHKVALGRQASLQQAQGAPRCQVAVDEQDRRLIAFQRLTFRRGRDTIPSESLPHPANCSL
jgi:hypothetical protein